MPQDDAKDVTELLESLRGGNAAEAEQLLPLVYDELYRIARYYFRREREDHTLQPTALIGEAFLKMVGPGRRGWENKAHFLAVAATAMRQVLVNHALARQAEKRGGGRDRVELEHLDVSDDASGDPGQQLDVLALHEMLERLAQIDPRKHRIVELRFFGGLSMDEIATVLELSKTTVETEWRAVRAWLTLELRKVQA